ncbi:MAG: NUDIX domain-containing protein [archaeon]
MDKQTEIADEKKHFVVATGIVIKNKKYLIAKRAEWEKAFPNRWTVPGGKLEVKEYLAREKDAKELWYNVVEDLVTREVKEEAGLEIDEWDYLTSLTYIRPDNYACIIISMFGHYGGGEVKLCKALTDYAWVTLEEAKKYDLIDGIYEELEMLDRFLKTGKKTRWVKN